MKRILISLAVIASLAACGGGGSSGSGVTTPPTNPPPAPQGYTAKINFSGDGARAQSFTANLPQSIRSTQATSGGQVVILTSRDFDTTQWSSSWITSAGVNYSQGRVTVQLSPQPSASPSAPPTWTNSTTGVSFSNSQNVSTVTAPSPDVFAVNIRGQSAGTLSASQPVPNGTPVPASSNVIVYDRLAIACTSVDPSVYGSSSVEAHGGTQMVNGVATPTDDITKADLYVSGPQCWGSYHSSESLITVHCPHGCQYIDGTNGFLTATAAQFTTPVTSFPIVTIPTDMNDRFGYILFSDSAGNKYKTTITLGNVTNTPFAGPYCKLTACPDGA